MGPIRMTVSYIVGILVATIAINAMAMMLDKNFADNVDKATEHLVESVSSEGYLSENMVDRFLKVLSVKHVEVRMYHKNSEERTLTNEDILSAVYETAQGIYKMEEGDRFDVEIYGNLFGRDVIISRKGRMIEYEAYH